MQYNRFSYTIFMAASACLCLLSACRSKGAGQDDKRPNILFVIADDQSFPYASAYGTSGVRTPAFDEVARNGILFYNAFVAAPQCSPSRAAILTGKNIWQLEEAGTHSSYFPKKFKVFTRLLENAGYATGYTGKPWGPGNWKDAGWKRNPVGTGYNRRTLLPPTKGISNVDYFANFVDFYKENKTGKPFFFWFGAHEPHRIYEKGSGKKAGKSGQQAFVPGFLPDDPVVRSDLADYALEIEWFDRQLGKMIEFLRREGQLENTLIVVTSDNGMPFPSAKANLMEYGTHVPLAVCWPAKIKGGRRSYDLVSLIDLAPTFMEVAGVKEAPWMTGKSLGDILFPRQDPPENKTHRTWVLTGRERHTHARPDDLGYPARAIRTDRFLFILNYKPDRWPAGNPPPAKETPPAATAQQDLKPIGPGYNDIDDPSPTKELMITEKEQWPRLFAEGFEKRPAEQLFDIQRDPACTKNLANDPAFDTVRLRLRKQLETLLMRQGDPRMLGYGDVFESYPRFGGMRNWPGFKKRGVYNPAFETDKQTLINQ